MQDIQPFYNWVDLYSSAEDELSPFYGRVYSEFEYSNTIYNYFIHPQWDDFGSPTLYIKIIYCDYEKSFAIIELMGEWNDAINNDIMTLKRDVIENLMEHGISRFILIGENVLNFHNSDDCYYQEWFEEVNETGWIAAINFRDHVLSEMQRANIDYYLLFGGELDNLNWRTYRPSQLMAKIDSIIRHRLG
ncbi:MAG: hypothetical protein JST71_04665 [Bacteroidetes bacterium]|jgi:hypothetical protein|nr:hypothetical protein [Bacteroidota bacterium]MBX7238700.1 hypothetical protein [Bacteroidia bacterium]MCC7513470.1 hypothetical protein [Bacteroidia bacterium]MCW5920099.1 hypothetical protein [Bacteroidota bacterium]HCI57692.1 hypothetical protein [Bacteroidota bacterium]